MNRFTKLCGMLTKKATGNRSTPTARPTVTLAIESLEGREMPATMSLQQLVQTHVNQFTSDFVHAENLKQTVSASTLARDVIALRNDVQSGQMSRVATVISRLTTDLVNEYKAVAYYNSTFGTHYESLFSSDNPYRANIYRDLQNLSSDVAAIQNSQQLFGFSTIDPNGGLYFGGIPGNT